MKNNCSDGKEKVAISNFYETLMFCLEDKAPLEKSTTTEENYFGGMFDLYDEEDFLKYASIEELLEGIKINIDDVLYEFYFGGYVHISPYQMTIDGRDLLRADWKAKLHYQYGFCYTFDPKDHGKSMVPINGKNQYEKHRTLLYMTLYLKVSNSNKSIIKLDCNFTFQFSVWQAEFT